MRENELMFGFPKRLNDQMGVGFPSGPYLLDQFPGAAAAYSVRRLSSTYTGPCMRVRNADNVEKDIYFDANGLVSESELRAHCCPGPNELPVSENIASPFYTIASSLTITPNSGADPLGGNTAMLMKESAVASNFNFRPNVTNVQGSTYAFSIYAKKGTGATAAYIIRLYNTGTCAANFNVDNGTIPYSIGCTSTITDVGNGWWRCGIVYTAAASNLYPYIMLTNNNPTAAGNPGYTGQSTTDIFIWGIQLTSSSEHLGYVKTTSVYTLSSGWITKWYDQTNTIQAGNLLLQTEALATTPWTASGVTMANNAGTFPYTNTANATRATTTSTTHDVYQEVSVSSSTDYNFSFWFLRGTMTDVKYSVYDVTNSADVIAPTSYYANALGGWTRVEIRFTTPSNCTTVRVSPLKNSGVTGTAFYWGAQLTKTTAMQTYMPITTIAISDQKRDLYQNTATLQPTIVTSGAINKNLRKPSLRFTGSTIDLIAGMQGSLLRQFATHFHVALMDSTSGSMLSSIYASAFYGKCSNYTDPTSSNFTGTTYFKKENKIQLMTNLSGLDLQKAYFGNCIATVIAPTYGWVRISFANAGYPLGTRQELIIYNSDMSNTRQAIENNINNFYGIY